jgi:6-phosphogluconolactonase
LVGTYTNNPEQGFHYVTFDEKLNQITKDVTVNGIENPSFIIANKAKNIVFLVEETASKLGGKISSFSYNVISKTFQRINSQPTLGDHPCSLALSPNEKFVVVTNYSGGNITVFPVDKDGKLGQSIQEKSYFNKGPNVSRQEKSHLHEVVFHPTEKILFVTDLGGDVIQQILFDENREATLQFEMAKISKLPVGVGPRHVVFSKNGKIAYATLELTNQIGVFSFDDGKLQFLKTIKLTDEEVVLDGPAAEIKLSQDEQFLYASLRGDFNVLVAFYVSDEKNLKEIQRIKIQIKPRNFIPTRTGDYILVGNQVSNTIISFKRDKKNRFVNRNRVGISN